MSHAGFVHLRVHTAYSLSEGAITIKDLIKQCQGMKMPAVAMTDTNNLFGALEFSDYASSGGVQPIIGCQLGLRREAVGETGFGQSREGRAPDPDPVVLLAQNETGYGNLIKLVSKAFLETDSGEEPQVSLADLEARNSGLILLTGGPAGPVGRLLALGQQAHAETLLKRLAQAFAGRTYVEIQRHGLEPESRTEGAFLDLAYKHDLPLVATNECFFTDIKMYEAHDALICIAAGAYLSQTERRRLTPEHRFKTPEEMIKLFADLPEAVDNTLVIARRCAVMSPKRKPLLPSKVQQGESEHDALCRLSRQGLAKRLEVHVYTPQMSAEEKEQAAKRYGERLDYELGVIAQMGFCGYFLIVADFIQWAKDHGIPVGPGRGSGAGSAVAWALTITDLDPLRFGLLFERFLNPERVSMPDFDIDFCQDRREEVIRYVQQEYGRDKVAQIITFGKLQARAALRDVGRVLQMPYGQVDRICKLVPNQPGTVITLPQALESETELRRERDQDETVAQMLDIAMKIEGLYRHASTHAAGVVIGDRPLDELVPLYRDPKSDMPVTQFNMKWVESAGLVKFDFLGLKTLTVLDKAVRLLAKRGVVIDLATIPFNDPATFAMLGRGDAVGVFQLESTGMRDVVRNMKPDSLEDLIAVVALYRPGPMDNIPSYIKRKHGEEKIDYLYPSLKPILEETYGIIIYQEQVMQIAQELSGYTLGGADLLRRAMGKKIASEMDQQRGVFTTGATARGVPEAKAKEIFDLVDKFANYGFNKSHAAAYAVVAYQTAYLKANYPVEFIAASMTLDMTNTDKLNVFRGELLRLGVSLLPPDVNSSLADFSVEDGKVRYALAAVRNVGEAAMRALVAERERGGPFASLSDFTRRMEAKTVNKRLLENLIKAGALDDLEPNRARLMEGIETILGVASLAASERASNQLGMFGGADQTPALKLPQVADWPPMEKLAREFESIGFYLSSHPLDAYGASLERLRVVPSAQLRERVERGGGGHLKLAGTVVSRKERTSKSGNRYAFVSLSDASGAFEVTFFSETLSAARAVLDSGVPVLLTVDARIEEDQLRITAQSCEALDNAVSKSTKRLEIRINSEAPLADLKAVIGEERKGRGEIVLVTCLGSEDVDIKLPGGYALSPTLIGALKNLAGLGEVREV